MCWLKDLPPELVKKRKLLTFLYCMFFVLSPLTFYLRWVFTGGQLFFDYTEANLLIMSYFSFPAILLYYIVECWILFCRKTYNTCTTILFRSVIALYDLTFIIFTLVDFVMVDDFTIEYLLLTLMGLLYLFRFVTNCSLLFIITRFPRKGLCSSSDNIE